MLRQKRFIVTKNTPTTPDNHPQINIKTHPSATHTQTDKTPHTTTQPTQMHNKTTTPNTPHTNQHTKSTNKKHKIKDKKITPIILDNLKPQTDFNVTKQQLKLAFLGKTFTIKQLKKGGIVLTQEKQEDVNAFLLHDRYNPQYSGQHMSLPTKRQ